MSMLQKKSKEFLDCLLAFAQIWAHACSRFENSATCAKQVLFFLIILTLVANVLTLGFALKGQESPPHSPRHARMNRPETRL